jgi:hypothetical protein
MDCRRESWPPAIERAGMNFRHAANEPMAEPFHLREHAERCRRIARDSTDSALRDSLLGLADEYIARVAAKENDHPAIWQAA